MLLKAQRDETCLVCSPTYTKMRDETLFTFVKLAKEFGVYQSQRGSPAVDVRLTTGPLVRFRSASEPDKLAGPNLSRAWLDEGGMMNEGVYSTVLGCLRENGRQGNLTVTSTPKGKHSWLYRTFGTGRPDTQEFHSRTSDNPFLPSGFSERLHQQYPAELQAQELEGEWTDDDDSRQVIPSSFVEAAMARWSPNHGQPLSAVGLDVAQGGLDRTVFAPRYGYEIGKLTVVPGRMTPDGSSVVTVLSEILAGRNPLVVIDTSGGWGGSVWDHCKALFPNLPLLAANSSARSEELDRHGLFGFSNLRSQMYWQLREALDPDGDVCLSLPPDDELAAELTCHKYKMTLRGVAVDPKDDVKKELGRSPDKADSVALSCLMPE